MKKYAVAVRNARKCYGKGENRNTILNGLNMTVNSGSMYALIGASGCGKTTLLSSIIGMNQLDGGDIMVFGEKLKPFKLSKSTSQIGFMPQEISLHMEFTVEETLNFYGNLYQLETDIIAERISVLRNLLQLPGDKQLVSNCSGGQQRRISLAVAMLHDPKLLILDEPTVGVDPLLRENIWVFLQNLTRNSDLAIIITTHYIEEAQKVDRCGLMRNGNLLAEDSPQAICSQTQSIDLSEAFLKLCCVDNVDIHSKETMGTFQKIPEAFEYKRETDTKSRKKFHRNTMKALIYKSFIQVFRQPASVYMIFMTLVLATFFNLTVGRNPTGIKLGFVSDELTNFEECRGMISSANLLKNGLCELEELSCRFINNLNDKIFHKLLFNNYEEALESIQAGNSIGFVYFKQNFSRSSRMFINHEFNETEQELNTILNGREIDVHLDRTNYHIYIFARKVLYEYYRSYSTEVMEKCNLSNYFKKLGIEFEKPIYGQQEMDMRLFMGPMAFLCLYFFAMSINTITNFIDDRNNGSWHRTFLSGISIYEYLFCHAFVHFMIGIFQMIMAISLLFYCYPDTLKANIPLEILFFFLIGLSGLCFGIVLGSLIDDISHASNAMNFVSLILFILPGYMWPIEAMPSYVGFFAKYLIPVIYPLHSFNGVVHKGHGLNHSSTWIGIFYLTSSIAIYLVISITVLRKKTFTH